MKKTLIFLLCISAFGFINVSCDLSDDTKDTLTDNSLTEETYETPADYQFTQEELDKAATAKGTTLSEEEQKVIQLCNLARLDGKKFLESYAKPYLKNKTNSYITSLYSTLASTKNLPMLYPEASLCKSAAYHAEDMGNKGMIGHNSSDGTDCFDRIESYYTGSGNLAENCSYGYSGALQIVMQLLVDENTPNLGHRKNILNPRYTAIGVAIRPHRSYNSNCVQDFADKIITKL